MSKTLPFDPYPGPEGLNRVLKKRYAGKRVLVTGHTGFKGSWLSEWLLHLGAEVYGYSLNPPTSPSLFESLGLAGRMNHQISDIRDAEAIGARIRDVRPDYVFHLAAQPLVLESYDIPYETWMTNVIGSIHVLEALRSIDYPCTAIMVTTDKCYRNVGQLEGYEEDDALGGDDPYSSSKAAAELAIHSWIHSFLQKQASLRVASVRAGNVIGGGDWAKDRIVPDCMNALSDGKSIFVRRPEATRPWQHVLEPLGGYLWLGSILSQVSESDYPRYQAFNFGPESESHRSVKDLVEEILRHWPGSWTSQVDEHAPHEATFLHLSVTKARELMGWVPHWEFPLTIQKTVNWYRRSCDTADHSPSFYQNLLKEDIEAYGSPF